LTLGGSECIARDVARLWEALPNLRVFNRYGPTETTIAVTTYEIEREDVAAGPVPIGEPHPGTRFFIVDAAGTSVDGPDQVGQLYVDGEQLMTGYFGDEQLSREVLRRDVVPGTVVYKTGDLVRRDPRGRYFYAGRTDDVVKRNGVRISLSEIASALQRIDGVGAAFCELLDNDGDDRLVAFVEAGPEVTPVGVMEGATLQLPVAMRPEKVIIVGSFPLSGTGKVDRQQVIAAAGWSPAPRKERL
jgi:acyl-CoA synthetase (AMP-forming)/AMP-acid ligase II